MEFPSVYPSVNPLVIKNFYYRGIYRRNFIGKLITDGICVLCRRKNSVSKTVKCCSETRFDLILREIKGRKSLFNLYM